jgi:CD2 antigen cytoplasmic tail-binding protein 2
MASSARPKRAAEDYVRSQVEDDVDGLQSKKPRFDIRNPSALAPDAAEEDAVLDADVIGGRGQNVRRNAVNIDGYDSDSDNEGFDARAAAKAKEKEAMSKEEDDDDMFADLAEDFKDGDESDGDAARKDGKKRAVRFLDEDEIEGQVQNSKSGGHVSAGFTLNGKGKSKAVRDQDVESSSDSDVGDEVRASTNNEVDEEIGAGGKKTHAPKLDAFNMKNEQEEGRFDDQGNYVRKAADADAKHDTWLEGVSKKDMKKAKDAADKREEERRKKAIEDDSIPTGEVLKTLIPFLERGETVLEALARLGKGKDKKPKWQNKNKNQNQRKRLNGSAMDVDMGEEDPAEAKRRSDVEAITGAADLLLTRGQPEIYDAERELLVRQYRKETGEDWADPKAITGSDPNVMKMWEYRWSDARDGGETHGPYDGVTMVAWNDAGYFGEGVEFRQQNAVDGWSKVVDFV